MLCNFSNKNVINCFQLKLFLFQYFLKFLFEYEFNFTLQCDPEVTVTSLLVMKGVCGWSFNGTGRIPHLWWWSIWTLTADLGHYCEGEGNFFAKHVPIPVLSACWEDQSFCKVGSRHTSPQRQTSVGCVKKGWRESVWSGPGGSSTFLQRRTQSAIVTVTPQKYNSRLRDYNFYLITKWQKIMAIWVAHN